MNNEHDGKSKGGAGIGILAVGVVLLWIGGMIQILAGMIAGALIVAALMLTIEQIPGFWSFACNPLGKIVVLFGTAWVTHATLGATTNLGAIALCTSLILKVIVINMKQRQRELGA